MNARGFVNFFEVRRNNASFHVGSKINVVWCSAIVSRSGRLAGAQTAGDSENQDMEAQMGQEVFNELKAKGEIIESSPLYDYLRPIAFAIGQGCTATI